MDRIEVLELVVAALVLLVLVAAFFPSPLVNRVLRSVVLLFTGLGALAGAAAVIFLVGVGGPGLLFLPFAAVAGLVCALAFVRTLYKLTEKPQADYEIPTVPGRGTTPREPKR